MALFDAFIIIESEDMSKMSRAPSERLTKLMLIYFENRTLFCCFAITIDCTGAFHAISQFQQMNRGINPSPYGNDFAEQSSTNDTFLSKIHIICSQFLVSNCLFVAVRNISRMFDNVFQE